MLQGPIISETSHIIEGIHQQNLSCKVSLDSCKADKALRSDAVSLIASLGVLKEVDRFLKDIQKEAWEETKEDPCLAPLAGIGGLIDIASSHLEKLFAASLVKVKESRQTLLWRFPKRR